MILRRIFSKLNYILLRFRVMQKALHWSIQLFFLFYNSRQAFWSDQQNFLRNIPAGTPRPIDVDSTSILPRYVEDKISTNFHVISMYFFDVISLIKKSMSFRRTFFDVISMAEKPTLFPRPQFGVSSMVEKSTLFLRTFLRRNFDGANIHVLSTHFFRGIFSGQKIHFVSTYFSGSNFAGREILVVSTYFFRRNFDE